MVWRFCSDIGTASDQTPRMVCTESSVVTTGRVLVDDLCPVASNRICCFISNVHLLYFD